MNQKQMLEKELRKFDANYQIERQVLVSKIEQAAKCIPTKEETELAIRLHSEMCTKDHTDHCDWYYDEGDCDRYSRSRYLGMARKLLERFDMDCIEDVKFIIKTVREI